MRSRQTRKRRHRRRKTQRGGFSFWPSSIAPRPTTAPRVGSVANPPPDTIPKSSFGATCGDPCMVDYGNHLDFTSANMTTWKIPEDWCRIRDERRPGCARKNLGANLDSGPHEPNLGSNTGSVVSNPGPVRSNTGSNTGSVGSSESVQSTNTITSIARNREIANKYPNPNPNLQARRLAAINARELKHTQTAKARSQVKVTL